METVTGRDSWHPEGMETTPITNTATQRITTSMAARMLELSENSIRNLADRGQLPCERIGRLRIFDLADIVRVRMVRAGRR